MGGGSFTVRDFASYSTTMNKCYNAVTNRIDGNQVFTARHIKGVLNPKNTCRECCNSEEHPNTIPVILALDVTGSMGEACTETASALGTIMTSLYDKYKDIEFCVMGIGDFECDDSPLQVSQYESDIRIAQRIDDIYMEHGGGGNGYESYTAAWYYGLYHTKLDSFDKQGRKGIIITMGDEPLNPDLPVGRLKQVLGVKEVGEVNTEKLYKKALEKFNIYHISIDSSRNCYQSYRNEIEDSWNPVLKENAKVSTIDNLANCIVECIDNALANNEVINDGNKTQVTEDGKITW